MPKIYLTKTWSAQTGTPRVAREVVVEEVLELKAQPGGDLALGGAQLADSFRRLGLIDEYWIYIHPVLLGRGTPLFKPLGQPDRAHARRNEDFRQRCGPAALHPLSRTGHAKASGRLSWGQPPPAFGSSACAVTTPRRGRRSRRRWP